MYKDVKEKAVAEMVHKQIYIEERHERLLKRISNIWTNGDVGSNTT